MTSGGQRVLLQSGALTRLTTPATAANTRPTVKIPAATVTSPLVSFCTLQLQVANLPWEVKSEEESPGPYAINSFGLLVRLSTRQ